MKLTSSSFFAALAFMLAVKVWLRLSRRKDRGLPRPPGPKPLPFIGNMLDMPIDMPWLVYDSWFKTHGWLFGSHNK